MIFKQPNGLYGRISTVADAPTHVDMTKKDVKDYLIRTGQLHPAVTVEGWLNSFEYPLEDSIDLVNTNNMTEQEIKDWKIKIGY